MARSKAVGEIAVIVGADISALKIGMDRAGGHLDRFGKKSNVVSARVARNMKRIGAAVAAVSIAVGAMVKLQLNSIEALSDTAAKANTTTKALQELRFAATQNGASTRDMDDALTRLSRRMSLFAQDGGGPAKKAIEALGLAVTDANGNLRNSDAVFADVVQALGNLENSATKAALASQLFGEDAGPRLMPLLNKGVAGIAAYREEAQRLGLVLDEAGVKKAAEVNAKFRALGDSMRMGLMRSVVDNADAISALAKTMEEDWIPAITNITSALSPFITKLGETLKAMTSVSRVWDALAAEITGAQGPLATSPDKVFKGPEYRPTVPRYIDPLDPAGLPLEFYGGGRGGDPRQFGFDPMEAALARYRANHPPETSPGGGGGGQSGPSEADLQAMQEAFATELELIQNNYDEQLAELESFRQAKLGKQAEFDELERRIKEKHEEDLADLEAKRRTAALQGMQGMFGDLATLMKSQNKKVFEIGKAAATAEAVIKGYQAAVDAWQKGMDVGGPGLAAAFTAASLAKTGVLISSIQSTSPGGSGGQVNPGGGGNSVPAPTAPASGQYIGVNLVGDIFGPDAVRALIAQINEQIEGGSIIRGISAT